MTSHLCCVGFDPRLKDIPKALHHNGNLKRTLVDFFAVILEATPQIPTIKINFAYFEQYGLEGLQALKECIAMARAVDKYVIADVKRGDIDISNHAYIQSVSQAWQAQAATFHTYLGKETFKILKHENLRPYFLIKTSNRDASLLQSIEVNSSASRPFFIHCLEHFLGDFPEGGFVFGATDTQALQSALAILRTTQAKPYLLLPGVGRQGGDGEKVVTLLRPHYGAELGQRVLLPISSAIIYAASREETQTRRVREAILAAAKTYADLLKA